MRTQRRVGLALLLALALPTLASAQTDGVEPRFRLNASIGPSFANVGTSLSTTTGAEFVLSNWAALAGEFGFLPNAPVDAASRLVSVPVEDPEDGRLHAYHWNGNLKLEPLDTGRLAGYLTAGLGAFSSEAIIEDAALGGAGQTRRMRTDFASNVGAGALYRFNEWVGLQLDYRTFFVHRDADTPRVHRVVTGLSFGGR